MTTEKTSRIRIDELTFFRFLAASIVVVFHFGRDATGFDGVLAAGPQMVTFFFVLSGFVLGISYMPAFTSAKRFWWARIARIVPVYLFALALMVFVLHVRAMEIDPWALLLNITLLQAWFSPYPLSINPPGWSLSVEAFFYAIFPLLLWWIYRRRVTPAWSLIMALGIWLMTQSVFSYALKHGMYGGFPSLSHDLIYYFPLSHLCSFLLGVAGAHWFLERRPCVSHEALSFVLVYGSIALVILAIEYENEIMRVLGTPLAFGSSFFAPLFLSLILVIATCRSRSCAVLRMRPLVLLGEASYSLYILQAPVFYLYSIYIAVHFTLSPLMYFVYYFIFLVLCSIISFLLLERPLNRLLRVSLPIWWESCEWGWLRRYASR